MQVPVLIIDDSEDDRYILKRLLTKSCIDIKVYEARDGQQALDFLASPTCFPASDTGVSPTPVLFVDINMPNVDGFEFLDSFKPIRERNPLLDDSLVFVLTSSTHPQDIDRALSLNYVNRFINKWEFDIKEIFTPLGLKRT